MNCCLFENYSGADIVQAQWVSFHSDINFFILLGCMIIFLNLHNITAVMVISVARF